MVNIEDQTMTKEELAKASALIGQVLQSYNVPAESIPEEPDALLMNPSRTLLSEDAIQNAPEHIVCLAAFIAEFSDSVVKELQRLNEKVDKIIKDSATSAEVVLKATEVQMSLMKALKEVPTQGFEHAPAFTPTPMIAKVEKKPTKAYIISKLEEMVKNGQTSVYTISSFENTGRLPKEVEEAIIASWNSDKVRI